MKRFFLAFLLLSLPVWAGGPWAGRYEFFEHAEPNQSWSYVLNISDAGTTLSVDGFQTCLRYRCRANVKGSSLVVAFESAGAENTARTYPPGAVLFTLDRSASGALTTRWGEMQPLLPANAQGGTAFEKSS